MGFELTTSRVIGWNLAQWATKTFIEGAEHAVFMSQWTRLNIRLANAGKKLFFKEKSFYFVFLDFSVQIRRNTKIDPERASYSLCHIFSCKSEQNSQIRLKQEIILFFIYIIMICIKFDKKI